MKINAEIKGDKFMYSYEVGDSKHNATVNLCADTMMAFVNLLQICSNSFKCSHESRMRNIQSKAAEIFEKGLEDKK